MIDLRNKSLPNTVCVNGRDFSIYTDFRVWLKFGEMIKTERLIKDYYFLFKNEIPNCDFFSALVDFYVNENKTPKSEKSDDIVFDYIEDGEYLVGSFQQVYGIDLTNCEMHWHRFQALFRSLPSTCKIIEIIGYRAYKKSNKKYEDEMEKMKHIWSLEQFENEVSPELMERFKTEFYNSI